MKKIKAIMTLAFVLVMAISTSAIIGGMWATAFGTPELIAPVTVSLTVLSLGTIFAFSKTEGYAFAGASVPFTQGICVAVQTSLLEILGSKAPQLKRTQVGYLQALVSSQNTAGITQVPVDPGNGKKKTVRITYIQRGSPSDVVHTDSTVCDPQVFPEPLETTADVTKFIATKWFGFNVEDMRLLCQADSEYRAMVMSSKIDILMVELDKKLIALQALNFGAFNPVIYTGFKDVELLTSNGAAMNYVGEAQMEADFQALDTTDRPIVIGAGKLNLYAKMAQIGCCNDGGLNLAQAGNMDFFYDRFVDGILGANHFIGLVPGYVQLLTWNKYVGSYLVDNDPIYAQGTVTDPLTGITLDMKWVYDYDCAEQYKVRFSLHYDLWFIPTNSFDTDDELSGVNFTLHYRAVNAAA